MSDSLPALLTLSYLRDSYDSGLLSPRKLIDALIARIESEPESERIWISRFSHEILDRFAAELERTGSKGKPLFGVPFAIKDNIDLDGLPTTAACPDFVYEPSDSATVVEKLIAAGAIPIGKTNLDQFATGLVGTRSPYGIPENAVVPGYIPGGSSSGSAISLARGQVAFSLGTDTAGSGRVPAALNGLVGLKPSCGRLSTRGVVPACRTLDCVSIFANRSADAEAVLAVAEGYDSSDPYSRAGFPEDAAFTESFRFGVPRDEDLEWFGDDLGPGLFEESILRAESLGGIPVSVSLAPFLEAARLLYEGPWVSERYLAVEDLITSSPEALHPVTREIISGGSAPKAIEAFRAIYQLAELKRRADEVWDRVDCILTPTVARAYTIEELAEDPIQLNSNMGYYTNFMNLLDYCALAVPSGKFGSGVPFGITAFAPAGRDRWLLNWGKRFETGEITTCCPADWIEIAVCGAHLEGLPLNFQLTDRAAIKVRQTRTAPYYQGFVIPEVDGLPPRPGLIRSDSKGGSIEVEVWALSPSGFGEFVSQIPSPLGIGKLELEDGREVSGFICETLAVEGAEEFTELGGWRAWVRNSHTKAQRHEGV
ncbi:MAG: allophanate hydrolase [Verrucomicrobiota bacterium]